MSSNGRARMLLAGGFGYAIGSFPTADLVSKYVSRRNGHAQAIDLRQTGTKNPGALNAAKVLGAKWGLLILVGDALKGLLACLAGRRIASDDGAYVAGIGAVVGHCLPVTTGFCGGKGLATSAGTSIVCFPAYMPIDLTLAAASTALSRGQAGKATYFASAVFTGAALYWHRAHKGNLWGPPATKWLPLYAASTSAIIAYKFLIAPALPVDAAVADASTGAPPTDQRAGLDDTEDAIVS